MSTNITSGKVQDCWQRAVFADATRHVFQQRFARYRVLLQLLAFLGILVPVLIGGVVMTLQGAALNVYLPFLLTLAGVIGLMQLVGTAANLAFKIEERYLYALGSMQANQALKSAFETLALNPTAADFDRRYDLLVDRDEERRRSDVEQTVSETERQAALRVALFNARRACGVCAQVPTLKTVPKELPGQPPPALADGRQQRWQACDNCGGPMPVLN